MIVRKDNKNIQPPYNNNNFIFISLYKGISYHIDFYLYDNGAKIFFPNFLPLTLQMVKN